MTEIDERSPSIHEELLWSLPCRSEITVGTIATELGSLNTIGIIGSQDRIIAKDKMTPITIMDSRFKAIIKIVLLAETYSIG